MKKIYTNIELQWNENTGKYDTIKEDYYYTDGPIDYAAKGDGMEGFDQSAEDSKQAIRDMRNLTDELANTVMSVNAGWKGVSKAKAGILDAGKEMLDDARKEYDAGNISLAQFQQKIKIVGKVKDGYMDLSTLLQDEAEITEEIARLRSIGHHAMADQLQDSADLLTMEKERMQVQEIQKGLMDAADELTGGMAGKVKDFVGAFGGANARLTGTLAIIGAIVGLMMALDAQVNEIGDNFGAIGVTEFRGELAGAKADAVGLGYGFGEVVEAVDALTQGLGIGIGEAAELSSEIMETAKATGMAVSETGQLFSTLVNVTGQSEETANNFMKQASMLATASGVAPKQVLSDMAASSEEIALFTKGTGENMVQAAVKAAQLGMSLGEVAGIAEGLLDFQSSIQREMEASALIGRQLNLSRARELALAGDLAGLQDEILNQVGSEAEFNAMNMIQRRALADSIGVSVAQMSRLVTESGKSREELMAMRDFDASELVSDDAMGQITKFMNMIKQAGYEIMASIGAAFEDISESEMQDMIDNLKWIGEWIGWFIVKLMEWGPALLVAYGVYKLIAITKGVIAFFSKDIAESEAQSGGGGDGSIFRGLKANDMIKGAFAILILAGAMVVAAFAFGMFGDVTWEAVGMGLATIVVLALVAMLLGQVAGQMIAGAFAVLLLGIALIPAAYAFSLLAGVDPLAIIAFAASLIILGLAVLGLGALMFTGIGALVFAAGIAALLALGFAVLVLGMGLALAAPNIGLFSEGALALVEPLSQLMPFAFPMLVLAASLMWLGPGLYFSGMAALFASGPFMILAYAFMLLNMSLEGIVEKLAPLTTMLYDLAGAALGIFSLSAALMTLAGTLSMVAIAGWFAIPILFTLAPLLHALGFGEDEEESADGAEEPSEMEELKNSMVKMQADMNKLLTGFQDGSFAEMIGQATGKNTGKIKAEISEPLI